MTIHRLAIAAAVIALLAARAPEARAGLSSAANAQGQEVHFAPQATLAFAKKVERTLAASGAQVAIVSRVGYPPDQLPAGMYYSHVAFAVYSRIATADGTQVPGYVMYNLYQEDRDPNRSDLVQDFPPDFFAAADSLEAGVVIPSPGLQKRLLALIASPSYAALHEPSYSVIANPYTLGRRQNCTEFVLDVINAAIYRTDDIARIKAAENAYFIAQPVDVSPLKLLVGLMFVPGLSLSDQPGQPMTATFERIADYLRKYDVGAEVLTVRPD